MQFNLEYLKALGGFSTALGSWALGYIAQAVDEVPSWAKALDTPLIVIGLAYGVVHLWRELAKERKARIDDRDAFDIKLRTDSERLLMATNKQTGVVEDLVRELRRNGIHKAKPGEDDDER